MLTKLVRGSCFECFQGPKVVLLLYRDSGEHPQLICNIHQLMIQRRELLLMTEIQPPVELTGENGLGEGKRLEGQGEEEGRSERKREFLLLIGNTISGYSSGKKDACIH